MKLIPYIEAYNIFEDAKIHYFRCQSFVHDKASINTYIWKEVWNFCNSHSFRKFNIATERQYYPYHGVIHHGPLNYYLTHNLHWNGEKYLISKWPNNYHHYYGYEEIENVGFDFSDEFRFREGEKPTLQLYEKKGKKFVKIYPDLFVKKPHRITEIDLDENLQYVDKNELADLIDMTWGIAHRDINPKQIEQLISEIQHLYSKRLINVREEYWKCYELYNEIFEIEGTFNPDPQVWYISDEEGNTIEDPHFDEKFISLEGLVDSLEFQENVYINNTDTINLFSRLFEAQILQIKNLIKEKKAFMYIRDNLTEVNKLLEKKYTIEKVKDILQRKYDLEKQVYSGQTKDHKELNSLKAECDNLIKHMNIEELE